MPLNMFVSFTTLYIWPESGSDIIRFKNLECLFNKHNSITKMILEIVSPVSRAHTTTNNIVYLFVQSLGRIQFTRMRQSGSQTDNICQFFFKYCVLSSQPAPGISFSPSNYFFSFFISFYSTKIDLERSVSVAREYFSDEKNHFQFRGDFNLCFQFWFSILASLLGINYSPR